MMKFNSEIMDMLLERDLGFFLELEFAEKDYSDEDLEKIYSSYELQTNLISEYLKRNRKQYLNYLHGQVVLMFEGGFLPAHFRIDGFTRDIRIIDFEAVGENWAIFDQWKKYERRKRLRKDAWDWITKIGASLGIILAIIEVFSFLKQAIK